MDQEKQQFIDDTYVYDLRDDLKNKSLSTKSKWFSRWIERLFLIILSGIVFTFLTLRSFGPGSLIIIDSNSNYKIDVDDYCTAGPATTAPVTVFQISTPVTIPITAYSVSQVIFSDIIGSDGKLEGSYTAPDIFNFTNALFTLNTTINSTTDLTSIHIGDLLVGDSQVWKTSTANSINGTINSSFVKNVTEYLSLFTEDKEISLDFSLYGDFEDASTVYEFTLELTLFNDTAIASSIDEDEDVSMTLTKPLKLKDILTPSGPADLVQPLSIDVSAGSSSFEIGPIPGNVTKAMMSLFASSSDEEKEWFSHVLDSSVSLFPSLPDLVGGGPLRIINIYVDNRFYSSISPLPFISNEGFTIVNDDSTDTHKMFYPIVSLSSFDLLQYDVDLTVLLPLLWSNSIKVTIEVTSPIKTAIPSSVPGSPPNPETLPHPVDPPKGDKVIKSDKWSISGNFLTWSSEYINGTESIGEIISFENSTKSSSVVLTLPPAPIGATRLNEIVKTDISSNFVSNFNITLISTDEEEKDPIQYNIISEFNSTGKSTSVKTFLSKVINSIYVMSSDNSNEEVLKISDNSTGKPTEIFKIESSNEYPLKLSSFKSSPKSSSLKLKSGKSISNSRKLGLNAMPNVLDVPLFSISKDTISHEINKNIKVGLSTLYSIKDKQESSIKSDTCITTKLKEELTENDFKIKVEANDGIIKP